MELHIIFFILAGLLIAVLIGFSLWSARREKSNIFSNTFSTRPIAVPPQNNKMSNSIPTSLQPQNEDYQAMSVPEENPQQIQQEVESSLQNIKISLPGGNPQQQPEQIQPIQSVAEPMVNTVVEETPQAVAIEPQETQSAEEENPFVTLYLYAPQNEAFRGDFVVHYLEEVGLRFGEHQIFHRHQHIDDSLSPIIFSAANLMNPGTFDLNNISNFATAGLVLFMQLPTEGNDVANMKLLISNAEHLAASLGGFLYDDNQQPFGEESRQRYMQRVMH